MDHMSISVISMIRNIPLLVLPHYCLKIIWISMPSPPFIRSIHIGIHKYILYAYGQVCIDSYLCTRRVRIRTETKSSHLSAFSYN